MKKLNKLCVEFHKMDLAGGQCPKCHNFKCGETYTEKLNKRVAEVPQETKQKVLDLLREGKTVGEACEGAGVELDIGSQIIYLNIGAYHFLNPVAV